MSQQQGQLSEIVLLFLKDSLSPKSLKRVENVCVFELCFTGVGSSVQNIMCHVCPTGNNPSNTQHTLISLSYGTKQYTSDWEIRAVETNNTWLKMGITPAADCIVGLYSTYVSVITNFGKQRSQRNQNTDFYVLFNPWAQSKHNCLSILSLSST